jgi:hypothetical protein
VNDPNQPFMPHAANVRFRIAKRTLRARISLCAEATGAIVGLLIWWRTLVVQVCLVAV